MSISNGGGDLAEKLKPAVLTLRMILFALASGVVTFGGFVIWMQMNGKLDQADEAGQSMTLIALGFAPVALVASRIVPSLMVRNARRQIAAGTFQLSRNVAAFLSELGDVGKLFSIHQTKTIVSGAILEGAAFLGVIAYMFGGSLIVLGMSVLLVGAILILFPSVPSVMEWIEEQMRLIEEEKNLAR